MIDIASSPSIVQVLLPRPFAEAFDYAVPEGLTLHIGDYVEVPIGKQIEQGVVWSIEPPSTSAAKIKMLLRRIDVPAMPEVLQKFIDWVAAYTLQPRGAVLKLALSTDSAQEEQATHALYIYKCVPPSLRLTNTRQRVLDVARQQGGLTQSDLAREAGCSTGVVRDLIESGALTEVRVGDKRAPQYQPDYHLPKFSLHQQKAADTLAAEVQAQRFSVTVLEGVTGSGKTEVFAHGIRQALRQKQQVLVLMPEIALTAQMMGRFVKLFGAEPLVWHSEIAQGARRRMWRQIAKGEAQLIMGARSALFLPFKDLGLIVVDEEHDSSYKQEEGVCYHARDMAVVRGQLSGCSVILSSATPSIETEINVRQGRYRHVYLPERHGTAELPTMCLVDLLKSKPPRGRWLAPDTVANIRATLSRGEQVLLFLNRRGYAPLTICRSCGHRLTCPHCTAWLVEHRAGRQSSQLCCHHCGYQTNLPQNCESCEAIDSFVACGPGVERIELEAKDLFPEAKTLTVVSDAMGHWKQTQQLLDAVAAGEYNLIIGTQIVAKGHHFPQLTLVVIVDADLGLESEDIRTRERCFQLLQQVSGRAGRAERAGSVVVQTHSPNNFLFQKLATHDREGFVDHEISLRQDHNWPPFSRLAALLLSGRDENLVTDAAKEMRIKSPLVDGVEIFGPAAAPLARLRDEYRVRLLIRSSRQLSIQKYLVEWLSSVHLPKGVTLKIIIDPFTFL